METIKAIILLSGGIDSTVALALALEKGRECYTLTFDYGQRHQIEIESASQVSAHYQIPHRVITVDSFAFQTSALVSEISILKDRTKEEIALAGIPNTYVPARNTVFMSYALGLAEVLGAKEIHIGSNALDYGPYPDCRPEYFAALTKLYALATKQSVDGNPPVPVTPLLYWDKAEIVKQGKRLNAPLHLTFSCYDPTPRGQHCYRCDSCRLRFAVI